MQRVCVYCGSSSGRRSAYRDQALALAQAMVERGMGLVYGGASVGLMGELADAMLAAGGEVLGIIPQSLMDKEVGHTGLSELRVVRSMHERKADMADAADGFIALPGGLGTLEELFEILTWAQLGLHAKPCALLDADNYYAGLLRFLDHSVEEGFVKGVHRGMLLSGDEPGAVLDAMRAYQAPDVWQWLRTQET